MNTILAWALSIVTFGNAPITTTFADPELQTYTVSIQEYVERLCHPEFSPVASVGWLQEQGMDHIGIAWLYLVGFSTIELDARFWFVSDHTLKTLLLAHELNHAWFNEDHTKPRELMGESISYLDVNVALGVAFSRVCAKQHKKINYEVLWEGVFP